MGVIVMVSAEQAKAGMMWGEMGIELMCTA